MVRIFPIAAETGKEIMHVYGDIDPLRDIKVINMELIIADMETVAKRISNIQREVKKGDKEFILENDALVRVLAALEAEQMANTVTLTEPELIKVKQLNLLTIKPILYGLNKRAGTKNLDETDPVLFKELCEYILSTGARFVVLDAKIEDELKDFEGEEKDMFRKEMGGETDGINNLITEGFNLLDLETYFTTGEDETRSWTIAKNSTAPIAGTAIHTDFKDKFIRAEVVYWQDLLDAGSYGEARAKGKVRTEGKEYVVKDGDVIEFKI
jgi:GTP-binding protein YchF